MIYNILLTIIACFIVILIFATIVNYYDNKNNARLGNGVKVKFKDFKELYAIAPARYRLDFDCAIYFGKEKNMYIYFSIFEHLFFYYKFRASKRNVKLELENAERAQEYIAQVKKDLDKFIATPPHK